MTRALENQRTKAVGGCVLCMAAVVIAGYVWLSAAAARPFGPADLAVYGNAVLRASLLHASENGVARSLGLANQAITHPISTDTIVLGQQQFVFPLLPRMVPQPHAAGQQGHIYLTFASDDELIDYITHSMPHAGWQNVDQEGAGHIFSDRKRTLVISIRYSLGTGIRALYVAPM